MQNLVSCCVGLKRGRSTSCRSLLKRRGSKAVDDQLRDAAFPSKKAAELVKAALAEPPPPVALSTWRCLRLEHTQGGRQVWDAGSQRVGLTVLLSLPAFLCLQLDVYPDLLGEELLCF